MSEDLQTKDRSFWIGIPLFFCMLSLLQLLSGTYLFFAKIGWNPADIVEYYHGSEVMLVHFPDRPDRFKPPASWEGRLEAVFAHAIAYSVIVFGLIHLLRSSVKDRAMRRRYDLLALVFFSSAAADIGLDFGILLAPWWIAPFKLPVFLLFVGSGMITLVLLCVALLRAPSDADGIPPQEPPFLSAPRKAD